MAAFRHGGRSGSHRAIGELGALAVAVVAHTWTPVARAGWIIAVDMPPEAALDLGMSTTAISNAVQKLERELAARLFNRTTRSISLTYARRIFVAQIKPAFEGTQKAMDTVRSQQEAPSGTLRINAPATAAREIMAPLVLTHLERYP